MLFSSYNTKTFMFPIAVTFMFLDHNIHVCSGLKPPYTV